MRVAKVAARNRVTEMIEARQAVKPLPTELLVRFATITFENEGPDPSVAALQRTLVRYRDDDGYNVSFRPDSGKSAAYWCLTWVRNMDFELGRRNGPRFTVVEWVNAPRGFKAPLVKEIK